MCSWFGDVPTQEGGVPQNQVDVIAHVADPQPKVGDVPAQEDDAACSRKKTSYHVLHILFCIYRNYKC